MPAVEMVGLHGCGGGLWLQEVPWALEAGDHGVIYRAQRCLVSAQRRHSYIASHTSQIR
jgi:hypothetical protein